MQVTRLAGALVALCLLGACGGQTAKTPKGAAAMPVAERTTAYEDVLGKSKNAAAEAARLRWRASATASPTNAK